MNIELFYNRFHLNTELAEKTGFNPYYPVLTSALSDPLLIDEAEFINLASNNYLGLSNDSRIKTAAIDAINKYGLSMCSTPIAAGYNNLLTKVQDKLSAFCGVEDCIIYPSCYQANNGLFSAIARQNDLILVDHYAHSSLIEGIKSARAKFRPFLHNNPAHLEEIILKSSSYEQVFVVIESVYSTEGALAPLNVINELCNKHNAILVIDDSHGIGVIGNGGKGALAMIKDFRGIYTASLGKAIANAGGMIGGRNKLIEFLKYYSSHFVYSTAIVPSVLGGIYSTLEIIEKEFNFLSEKMYRYKSILEDALLNNNFKLSKNETPIISIESGNSEQTIRLAEKFFKNKILTTPFIYPSVPEKGGRIRIIAGANLKEETIHKAAEIFSSTG